jgi:multiple sugar transport system ATP-binding protein
VEVTLNKVTKYFGNVKAVDEVSLKVFDKEFLTLLGPSGCGKTTTLRLIAGLEQTTSGDIYIGDRKVNDVPAKDRNIAMVFQSYALYPHMSVFDNIAFPLANRGAPRAEIRKRVDETAELLGIADLLKRKPKQLSGGQRQRVALGRAIVREPNVFLMDEPLSNLDAKMRAHMRAELKRLQKKLGTTLIYVTHDQVEAMTMSHRIAIMNEGKLQQVDSPEEVYSRPRNIWVAGFVGSPAMNFFDCSFKDEDGVGVLDTGEFAFVVPNDVAAVLRENSSGSELVFGIRPEDISVKKKPEPESVEGTVYVLEPIGESVIVDAYIGQRFVRARAEASFKAETDEKIYLTFDQARLHIFDKKQETAIL